MRRAVLLRVGPIVFILLAATAVHADERDLLNHCKALVEDAAQPQTSGAASAKADDPEISRCRQIIREWTLRDSRMSVDENGRPLR
jgi:hypothetical protein